MFTVIDFLNVHSLNLGFHLINEYLLSVFISTVNLPQES